MNTFFVPIIIQEYEGITRKNEATIVGIPFPKGQIFETQQLELLNSLGNLIPIQSKILSCWSDKSIKWVLLDFFVNIEGNTREEYKLSGGSSKLNEDIQPTILINETDESIVIDTGKCIFHVSTDSYKPFSQIFVDGRPMLDESKSYINLTDQKGRRYTPEIIKTIVETRGPIKSTIRIDGKMFATAGEKGIAFFSKISFYANSSLVKITFSIRNSKAAMHLGGFWDLGDEGSFFFKDLSLQLALQADMDTITNWAVQPDIPLKKVDSDSVIIYQDSSGGKNWNSSNHVNRHGKVMNSFKGFRVYGDQDEVIEEGDRANPEITIKNGGTIISAAMQSFWQNFPSSIEGENNILRIGLFPSQYKGGFELQGGEQKTHTIFFQFSEEGDRLNWIQYPIVPQVNPDWVEKTKVFSYFALPNSNTTPEYQQLIDCAIKDENNFFDRRETIDEYGWRNFGDLVADHETYERKNVVGTSPLVSHYNNQYDTIYGALFQYAGSADPRWFQLAKELADHVLDIDIYHTCEDKAIYNNSLFFHTNHFTDAATATHRAMSKNKVREDLQAYENSSGGPGYDHVYTKGLLYYYYMTGNDAAKDAVIQLAGWVICGVDGLGTTLESMEKVIKSGISWLKEKWSGKKIAFPYAFEGPGRPSGNALNVFLDAFELTKDKMYIEKAEQLIRICIHPNDDIQSRNLLDPITKWMYTVFLQALGGYLDKKCEIAEQDHMFYYARESLLHYAKWMLIYEYPFLSKPELLDYPNYSTRAAQDIRKCNVFLFASKYCSSENFSKDFSSKADFFYKTSIDCLKQQKTKSLTRPIAILMLVGGMHFYFDLHPMGTNIEKETEKFGKPYPDASAVCKVLRRTSSFLRTLRNTSLKKEIWWAQYRLRSISWEIQNRFFS